MTLDSAAIMHGIAGDATPRVTASTPMRRALGGPDYLAPGIEAHRDRSTTDRSGFYGRSAHPVMRPEVDLMREQAPIILAEKLGIVLPCNVAPQHPKGADTTGVIVVPGGAIACRTCYEGGAA